MLLQIEVLNVAHQLHAVRRHAQAFKLQLPPRLRPPAAWTARQPAERFPIPARCLAHRPAGRSLMPGARIPARASANGPNSLRTASKQGCLIMAHRCTVCRWPIPQREAESSPRQAFVQPPTTAAFHRDMKDRPESLTRYGSTQVQDASAFYLSAPGSRSAARFSSARLRMISNASF
jgi:hypothetical protein